MKKNKNLTKDNTNTEKYLSVFSGVLKLSGVFEYVRKYKEFTSKELRNQSFALKQLELSEIDDILIHMLNAGLLESIQDGEIMTYTLDSLTFFDSEA